MNEVPGSKCYGIERKERVVYLGMGFEKRESGEVWKNDERHWKWMRGVGVGRNWRWGV